MDSKKGGLDIHRAEYDENIEGVISGGNFESRFGLNKYQINILFALPNNAVIFPQDWEAIDWSTVQWQET